MHVQLLQTPHRFIIVTNSFSVIDGEEEVEKEEEAKIEENNDEDGASFEDEVQANQDTITIVSVIATQYMQHVVHTVTLLMFTFFQHRLQFFGIKFFTNLTSSTN